MKYEHKIKSFYESLFLIVNYKQIYQNDLEDRGFQQTAQPYVDQMRLDL